MPPSFDNTRGIPASGEHVAHDDPRAAARWVPRLIGTVAKAANAERWTPT